MINKTADEIDAKFNEEFLAPGKLAVDFKSYALFFIYYSGHGVMNGNKTVGIAFDDSRIELDLYIQQLSKRANTFTIAFLDCCRVFEKNKGDDVPLFKFNETQHAQSYIIYAAAQGDPAISIEGSLSKATASFLMHMNAYD